MAQFENAELAGRKKSSAFKVGQVVHPQSPDEQTDTSSSATEHPGMLAPIACKILMTLLWAARTTRFDLLRAVNHLPKYVTKWTSKQDKELYRLMCYIKSSKHLRMIGWVGDGLGAISPHLYADADFAGCVETQ